MRYFILLIMFVVLSNNTAYTQTLSAVGTVYDAKSKQKLTGVAVALLGDQFTHTISDKNGRFKLRSLQSLPVVLTFNYSGYAPQSIEINNNDDLDVYLQPITQSGKNEVSSVTGLEQPLLEAPARVQKITFQLINASAAANFYPSLNYMPNSTLITTGANTYLYTLRNFSSFGDTLQDGHLWSNYSSPILQYIDGIDNRSLLYNCAFGNNFGLPDVDVENIEVLDGGQSALYGEGALNGGVFIKSKNPFAYRGISALVHTNTKGLLQAQFRVAKTLNKQKTLAFKITGNLSQSNELFSDIKHGLNDTIKVLVNDNEKSANTTISDAYYVWLQSNSNANSNQIINFFPNTFQENFISRVNKNSNTLLNTGLYYKLFTNTSLSYNYSFALNNGNLQNHILRSQFKNYTLQNHIFSLQSKQLKVNAGYTIENNGKGDAYFNVANHITFKGILDFALPLYYQNYANTLQNYSNNFTSAVTNEQVLEAHNIALKAAANAPKYLPNTTAFDSLLLTLKDTLMYTIDNKNTAKRVFLNAEYTFNIKNSKFLTGFNYKKLTYKTLLNKNYPYSQNGSNYGVYAQVMQKLFKNKVQLVANLYANMVNNYEFILTPRVAVNANFNKHILWFSWQKGISKNNSYLLEDINNQKFYKTNNLDAGYRFLPNNKLFIDVAGYFANFSNNSFKTNSCKLYGTNLSLNYELNKAITAQAAQTFNISENIDNAYTVGMKKTTLSILGNRILKNLGFATTFQYVYFSKKQSAEINKINSNITVDAKLYYELPKYYSRISIGSTNLLNNTVSQNLFAPTLGRVIYTSLLFDFNKW